ncbi:MAG: hypothetical protein AVDCRST_MAG22-124, partial [uncultured Rubrobacteraceae bacterium]
ERRRQTGPGQPRGGRAAAPDLRRRPRRGPDAEPAPPNAFPAQSPLEDPGMAARLRRALARALGLSRDAPGRDQRGPVPSHDRHRRGGTLPLYPQPALRGDGPGLLRHKRQGERAPGRAGAPGRPAPRGPRRHKARGALPGGQVRRRVQAVQGEGAALDL